MIRHTLWAGWWALLIAALLAIVLTAFRVAFPLLGEFKSELEQRIGHLVGVDVSISSFETGWRGPFPTFDVGDITALGVVQGDSHIDFQLDRIRFEFDPWKSFIDMAPIFQEVEAQGLDVTWHQGKGRENGSSSRSELNTDAIGVLIGVLLEQPSMRFTDSNLHLFPLTGPSRTIKLDTMALESSESEHQLSGRFWMPVFGENTQLEFTIQSRGELDNDRPVLPFYLKLNNLGPELFNTAGFNSGLETITLGGELWGQLRGATLDHIVGQVDVKDLTWKSNDQLVSLDHGSAQLSLQSVAGEYQLQLKNLQAVSKGQSLELSMAAMDINRGLDGWSVNRLQADRIAINDVKDLLSVQSLNPQLQELIAELDPHGHVSNISIDLSRGISQAYLVSDLENISLESWNGTPMVSQLNGLLTLSQQGGSVELASERLVMQFPSVYDWALPFNKAKGRVEWQLNSDSAEVFSSHLTLGLNGMETHGAFSIDLPYDKTKQGFLNLSLGLQGAKIRDALLLAPPNIIGNKLYRWLGDSLKTGSVSEAGLTLITPMRRLEDRPKPLSELYIVAEDAELDYQAGWPSLVDADSIIHVREGATRVVVQRGEVINNELSYADVWLAKGESDINIKLALEGSAFELNNLFDSDPLKSSVGEALKDWQIAGVHQSLVELDLSLQGEKPSLLVTTDLTSGVFASQAQRLAITNIEGQLFYDLSSGLSGSQLSADLLGRNFDVDLVSDNKKTSIKVAGRIDSHRLMDWANVPLNAIIRGEIPLLATLNLCREGCESSLQIESSLVGTEVRAPDYLYHSGKQPGRLSLQLGLSSNPRLQLNYADRLRAELYVTQPLTGNIRLGGAPANSTPSDTLLIDGTVPKLSLPEIVEFIGSLNNQGGTTNEGFKLDIDLLIDQLIAGSLNFEQVETRVSPVSYGWSISANSQDFQGSAIFDSAKNSVNADITHIHLRTTDTESQGDQISPEVPLPAPTPEDLLSKIPSGVVLIQSLTLNGKDWGRWQGRLSPSDKGVALDQIQGEVGGLSINGEGQWTLGSSEKTQIALNYSGVNLADYLEAMGDPRAVETQSVSGGVNLLWPGAPWSFSHYRLEGNLNFDLRDGQLTEAKGGSSLLRLLGILNFNNLFKRLKLDFSDLYKQGVAFDKLVGEYTIKSGVANSTSPLIMRGPSADLTASGQVNLIERSLDQTLDVILPIAGNTPLAAVLLGSPQIAGALFLIDKLLGDKINEATKLSYRLSGPWKDPQLEQISSASN